ncbi:26S proteasome non-ATPase regulatory subunit 10-like [Bradysia coprophila]|uniref:26S proteasome non-ATPase regulatory subunit 10-like n=1 Tax=Bradysia coprophila TaxID=38358 RepID=UPI00187D839C|nr:26S proteasome non-ATPase regulatory subunit 10-like [Bradysia coprophila]
MALFIVLLFTIIGTVLAAPPLTSVSRASSPTIRALANTIFGASRSTLLHVAVILDHEDHIVSLIQKGVDVNKKDIHGMASLHMAAAFGSETAVKLLIANGANVNEYADYFDEYETAPLIFAYKYGRDVNVKLLLENGADKKLLDHYQFDELHPIMACGEYADQSDEDGPSIDQMKESFKPYTADYDKVVRALGIA